MSGEQTPGEQTPGDQTPSDQTPSDQTPGDQTPRDQTPRDQTPGDQMPGDPPPAETTDDAEAEGETEDGDGADTVPPKEFADWTPEQIKAWGNAQKLRSANSNDRTLVFRQMHIALTLILGGATIALIGLLVISEKDTVKLTAIVSIATAVIGSGAALLPTGAAAGAAARILSRDDKSDQGGSRGTG